MSKEITEKINAGISGGIESMRKSVQDMILNILKEHAPELNEKQRNELCQAWLPDGIGKSGKSGGKGSSLPPDVLLSMIEQFIAFSHGEMQESVDKSLRDEMGTWTERYWNSFPPVVQQLIADYLKDKITEKEFKSRICIALGL